jgi:SAM-dependent methyltransferase
VRAQYEALPYPPRDPRDEAKRLVTGSPSHLDEVIHYVCGGRFDRTRAFRALIAGGGTGDAAIMLGQQLADAGAERAEVVYLDWSTASRKIAEARAQARGLRNIRFVTGSLLDLPQLDLGLFDYIDCCGVLHHLDSPPSGLAALTQALAPQGGIGVMVYGWLGRSGVYPVQALVKALVPEDQAPPERLAIARKLLAQLPATNWLKRNPFVADHIAEGDAGLYDLLLHARDRAYDVRELAALVAGAGLRIVDFIPAARYAPETYLSDGALLKRVAGLNKLERAAFAENIAGNIKSHIVYAVRAGNTVNPPNPADNDAVPVLCQVDAATLARGLKPGGVLSADLDGTTLRLPLPRLAAAIVGLIDGRRSLTAIHAHLQANGAAGDRADFQAPVAQRVTALHGIGNRMLHKP